MINPDTLTVNPQEADTTAMVTSAARKFEHIRITQSLGLWHWQRVYADGKLAQTGSESYRTEICAARVAATVAHCHGVPAMLPRHLEPALAQLWAREGADKFFGGYSFDICWNRHQRDGYLAAMEEAEAERSETEPMYTDWRV